MTDVAPESGELTGLGTEYFHTAEETVETSLHAMYVARSPFA